MHRFVFGVFGLLVAATVLAPSAVAEDAPSKTKRNSIGAGVFYHSPGDPLDDGVGFGVQYTRSLAHVLLRAELSSMSLEEDQGGDDFDFLALSVGALWAFSPDSWRVRLAVGGGIEYIDGDGGETVVEPPPIDIRNTFEVDSGIGFHGDFEAALPLGSAWELYGRVSYLVATLDAERRFIVSGVPGGNPESVDLELDGPQLTIGVAFRF
jgi:hypothetical protein